MYPRSLEIPTKPPSKNLNVVSNIDDAIPLGIVVSAIWNIYRRTLGLKNKYDGLWGGDTRKQKASAKINSILRLKRDVKGGGYNAFICS